MTGEVLKNWLRNATDEEVLEMYSSNLLALANADGVIDYLDRQEAVTLCKANLRERMSR